MESSTDITQLLLAYTDGNGEALDQLLPLVYSNLKRMAHARLRDERPDHTLNTTGLVHEAYLKLVDIKQVKYQGRDHFFAMASKLMRRILVDYAVARKAQKRGGGLQNEELDEGRLIPDEHAETLLELDDALKRLEQLHPRPAEVIQHRYFGGLTTAEAAGARAPIDSIAVLPLENMTGNPEQEYVADGMTEALISNLGQIKGLRRVISRTSVMQFKKTGKSLSEIGRTLDVAAIVEGSVRSFGKQVQIDVRLIEAETEERLWEQRFTRATDDVLTLQNEVALAIARVVEVRMTATYEARLAEGREVNPKVYDLYLKGLQARVHDHPTRSEVIAYFEQAIAVDSSFAPAYAALAIEYALAGGFDMLPGGEVKAQQLAEKALALNPSLSEPYIALGLLREVGDWEWAGAEEAFRRAIERNPGDAFAQHELAQLWMRMGRFEQALAQEKQALLLDPLSSRYQSGVGEVYLFGGRYDEAIVELKKAHALNPREGTPYLGLSYWQKGDYKEALDWWAASEGPFDVEYVEEGRARLAAVKGQREKAAAVVKEWEDGWSKGEYGKNIVWLIATVYADLGEKDKALDWLDRAYETRLGLLVYVKVHPRFYSLHREPRFQALLEKMGLHRE